MKAMILAAGKGTRLRPITDTVPKALVPIKDIPILEHNIKKLIGFGFNEIIINTHYLGGQIIDFLKLKNNFGIHIEVSEEKETLMDTGGGLKQAAWFFNDNQPFLLHNADVLTDLDIGQMMKQHHQQCNLVTLFMQDRKSSRKLQFNKAGELLGWLDKKTEERKVAKSGVCEYELAFSCVHIINPSIFPLIEESGVFSIIDLYLRLAKTERIGFFNPSNTFFLDIGTPEQLAKADRYL